MDVVTALQLIAKHLPGQHDQSSHGRGGGSSARGTTRSKGRPTAAADKAVRDHLTKFMRAMDQSKSWPGLDKRHPFTEDKGDTRGEVHAALKKLGFKQSHGPDKYRYTHPDGTGARVAYGQNSTRTTFVPKGSKAYG